MERNERKGGKKRLGVEGWMQENRREWKGNGMKQNGMEWNEMKKELEEKGLEWNGMEQNRKKKE